MTLEITIEQTIQDALHALKLRSKNQDVKTSNAIRERFGSVRTTIIEHFVKSRLGNHSFTTTTQEGDLVETPRGIALVSNQQIEEGEIIAYGSCRTPEMYNVHAMANEKGEIHILYVSDEIRSKTRRILKKVYSHLKINPSQGTIDRKQVYVELEKDNGPIVACEKINGIPRLTITEESGGVSHYKLALNLATRKMDIIPASSDSRRNIHQYLRIQRLIEH